MSREKILVVDDEEDILELITFNLLKEGFQVTGVSSGEDAIAKAGEGKPDLVILDLMLPGLDGLEVCKKLKNRPETGNVPIIMLTAKGEESDIVTGLELGADDYITKPFSPRVLIARVKAVLRRKSNFQVKEDDTIDLHNIVIKPRKHKVEISGKLVNLTLTEFRLLHCLMRKPGWVFTRYQIVDEVRGEDYHVTDRSIDVQVVGLRKKLGAAGKCVETVRGIGYRFKEEV